MFRRRWFMLAFFLLVLTAVGLGVRYVPHWQWIVEHEQSWRMRVQQAPILSFCIAIPLYTLLSLIPGTSGKAVVCGWLLGLWSAIMVIEIGLTAAAAISFLISRYIIRHGVQTRWRSRLAILGKRVDRDGAFYLLLLRLTHTPFTLVNYCAGATGIPVSTFAWTTFLGLLPATTVFAYIGTRIPTLAEVSRDGVWSLVDWPLWIVLSATFLIPILFRPVIRCIQSIRKVGSKASASGT